MKFERLNNNNEKIEISDHIKAQLKNLGLTLDEIKGRVLDVGAGEAEFEKDLEKLTGAEIVSLDGKKREGMPDNVVIANARELPFKENSFDRVVSHASMPNVFIGMYSEDFPELSKEEIRKSISKTFREMLRVLKSGSSATMAPVRIGDTYSSEEAFAGALDEVIEEIREEADVSFELIREVENPHNREKHKEYRLTLLKK